LAVRPWRDNSGRKPYVAPGDAMDCSRKSVNECNDSITMSAPRPE
jgi:hypothetical protein